MTHDSRLEAEAIALFEAALEQPSAERHDWLIANTAERPLLRARALALYKSDATTKNSAVTGGALPIYEAGHDAVPDVIGQYRVIRLIGRGGMGAVYLGERTTGDFDHRVAIKVVRGIGRSERLAERLRLERQTLARLQHPAIANLFDGGETVTGEPYFIMEYVDGDPLDDYLDTVNPALNVRLTIFKSICDAVAYAHQQLIVHRDLSPSNILVTPEGRVKLIDFGISRSFSDNAQDDASRFTMTKAYAAPERLEGEAATTLGDIFSLGVILRELVGGLPVEAPVDLNAIAAKAAHAEPGERYGSVGELSTDIDRFISGHTVSARAGGAFYSLALFVRRRPIGVGAAFAGIAAGAAALVITTTLYQQATIARADADRRFDDVRELANYMLFDLYDQLSAIPGTTKALSGIADNSRVYLDALSDDARADLALQLETAIGYRRLGDVVGNPIGANLGRREEAGELLKKAFVQLEELHLREPQDIGVARAFAETAFSLSVYEFIAIDDNEAAIDYAKRAEALYAIVAESDVALLEDKIKRIDSKAQSAKPLTWMGEGEAAIAVLSEVREETLALIDANPESLQPKRLGATMHTALAEAMGRHFDVAGGDYAAALPHHERAIAYHNEIASADPENSNARRNLVSAHYKRSLIYVELGEYELALADIDEAESIAAEFLGKDPEDFGMKRNLSAVHEQKATTLAAIGRFDEATSLAIKLVDEAKAWSGAQPENAALVRDLAMTQYLAADIFISASRQAEACSLFHSARANWDYLETHGEVSEYDRETSIGEIDLQLGEC